MRFENDLGRRSTRLRNLLIDLGNRCAWCTQLDTADGIYKTRDYWKRNVVGEGWRL